MIFIDNYLEILKINKIIRKPGKTTVVSLIPTIRMCVPIYTFTILISSIVD